MMYLFLACGILGMLGATWLFPLSACLLVRRAKAKPKACVYPAQQSRTIAILIPARNEQDTLRSTLCSINESITYAKYAQPELEVLVMVCANGCTDNTAEIARECGAKVIDAPHESGKWQSLMLLHDTCGKLSVKPEWLAFVDSGVLWPRELLRQVLARTKDLDVVGVAPSYQNPSGGAVEKFVWGVERNLKSLEAQVGGPVSSHGATVFYRSDALSDALALLDGRSWLNDDVALPLMLRASNPTKHFLYLSDLAVSEQPELCSRVSRTFREYWRRKRMVIGNIQWIRCLFPLVWQQSSAVALLALRRVFRVFWIYWLVSFVLGLALLYFSEVEFAQAAITFIFAITALFVSSRILPAFSALWSAAGASLVAPYYLFFGNHLEHGVWK